MNIRSIASGLLSITLSAAAIAQVPFENIKVGTALDSKGIELGVFTKAMPLPPGDWEVVGRNDSQIKLTGGTHSSAATIELTLRSTNKGNGIAAMVLSFTPDAIKIRWSNDKCENTKYPIVEDFGGTSGSLLYACAFANQYPSGLKKLIEGAPASANTWIKRNLTSLIPYVADMPEAYTWMYLTANLEHGRRVFYTAYAKALLTSNSSDRFGTETRAWVKSTGKAVMGFLENDAIAIPPYPSIEPIGIAAGS